jgi:hypothetical protein
MDKILLELINIGKLHREDMVISKINFNEILEDIKRNIIYRQDFAGIKFHSNINVKNDFHSDPSLIHSILQNLIDNGIKYRNPRVRESFISVIIREYRNKIMIIVSDNGLGMNEETQKRAFEMFYRGSTTSQGTGLGLYTVKTSVEKLGGSVKLKSEEQKGSTFTIYLPNISA